MANTWRIALTAACLAAACLPAVVHSYAAKGGPLLKSLKGESAWVTAYLMYRQEPALKITGSRQYQTLLAPTDLAWYSFFVDYQAGSTYVKVPPGEVRAHFLVDLSIYTPKQFSKLMEGMIDREPNFALLMVDLLNHMILSGNYSTNQMKHLKKDQVIATATRFPVYVTKTHPVTFKAVPTDFDDASFSKQREMNPMYIPRMLDRKSAVLSANVYNESKFNVHVVDEVVPIVDLAVVDPIFPPPPKAASRQYTPSLLLLSLPSLLLALFSFGCFTSSFPL